MKNKLKILFILLITNVGFTFGNCFGLEIEKLAQSINYPELGYYEDIVLQFKIESGSFIVDSSFSKNRWISYQKIIREVEKIKINNNCSDIPNLIRIRFELKWEDSIKYKDSELIIHKNALAIPTKSFGFYYSNALICANEKNNSSVKVVEGTSLVFGYYSREYDNPFVPEEQQKELIYFQIPMGVEEFEYRDNELELLNLSYENFCVQGCGMERIIKGKIRGVLKSGIWMIELNFKNREFKFNYSESDEIKLSK